MKEIQKILFPLDLSASSPRLVPYVTMMRRKFGAELHLLFVARAFQHFRGIYVPNLSVETLESDLMKGAERRIHEFRDEYFSGIPHVQTAVVSGDISEEILSYIDTRHIDLVILGTHGRKTLEKVFFGSVAERIVKMSPVPVLIVNPHRI